MILVYGFVSLYKTSILITIGNIITSKINESCMIAYESGMSQEDYRCRVFVKVYYLIVCVQVQQVLTNVTANSV